MWLGCSQSLAQWQAGAWGGVRPVNQKKTRCFGRGFKEADRGSDLRLSRAELQEH